MPKRYTSVKGILEDFCDDSSIQACSFFTKKHVSYTEKFLWAVFNIALATVTMYFIYFLCNEYSENPTVVTLDSSDFPIQNVKHPGISICNINKISRKRAYALAESLQKYLQKKDISVDISTILEDIKLYGSFYDLTVHTESTFVRIQDLLYNYSNKTEGYDPTVRLLKLITPCHEILKKCHWGGREYPCQDLFLTRMTFEGFCCVFNYVRPYRRKHLYNDINSREVPTVSEAPQGSGVENGLVVTLKNDPEDNFFTSMETDGFNIHVFYPEDFPDKLSGSLTEVFINANMEALISIDVDVIRSSPEIKMLPISMRRCKFADDETTLFGSYRESDCYVTCRTETLKSLCKCVPFMIPNATYASKTVSTCSFEDIPCLNKYKEKWSRYFPHGAEKGSFEQELYDSISCEQCLPPCNNIHYNVFTNLGVADATHDDDRNTTRVAIFFNRAFCNVYRVDLTSLWFEELSLFGGMLSLFLGLSLISMVEIFVLVFRIIKLLLTKFIKKQKRCF